MNDNLYHIKGETLEGIADAIRGISNSSETMTPAQMIAKIKALKIPVSSHTNLITGEWERPSNWPDLDSINMPEGFDGCYLTYDLTKIDTPWIGIYATTTGGNYLVDRGHLSNGEFVVDETHSVTQDTYFRQDLDSTYGNIQLWRITAATSGKYLTNVSFVARTTNSANNTYNVYQSCVERIGIMDYAYPATGTMGFDPAHKRHCTMWMEHDGLIIGRKRDVTSLSSVWNFAISLQKLDLEDWDTSGWHVTSLSSTWSTCINLKKIDISNWDTSNWTVTKMDNTFYQCLSLEELKLNNWNTFNWDVTTISYAFYYCYSLKKLEIDKWNTSNWHVTNISYCWASCCSLEELDLNNWNTSNWAVTAIRNLCIYCMSLKVLKINNWDTSNWAINGSFAYSWYYCKNLRELDLSNWDTSNWNITSLESTWGYCNNLHILKIGTWDTNNWHVTSLSGTWTYCESLIELEATNWETSNWAITNLQNTFGNCISLTNLDLTNWDTSNWAATTMASTFNNCISLESIDMSNWDTSNWNVTTLSYTFYNCYTLKLLNISNWDTSNWALTNIGYTWEYCMSLQSLDISSWNTTKWAITQNNVFIAYCYSLVTLLLPADMKLSSSSSNISGSPNACYSLTNFSGFNMPKTHNYNSDYKLSRQSVLNIIDRLPQINTTQTVTITGFNLHKVTAEEIAVATQKGWTVA